LHFEQAIVTLGAASAGFTGRFVAGFDAGFTAVVLVAGNPGLATTLAIVGTVNEAPHGHFDRCPASSGLTSSFLWQLVQLNRIM